MTAYRRGKNKWAAKYTLDGETIWVKGGPWSTKRQAQEAEQRDRDKRRARLTDESCASFAERWTQEWRRPSTSTQRLYEAAARKFADEFGPTPIAEVKRLEARAWALTVSKKTSSIISTMFEDARNVGLVEANPFSALRLPQRVRKSEIKPPTLDEYRALLAACPVLGGYSGEFRAMIQFAAWTGIRQGELFGLQWDDVRSDSMIHVARSRKPDGSLGKPKNGWERDMPVRTEAQVLDQVPRRPDPFIFHTVRGRPFAKASHAWPWQKVKAAAGVECRWHDLRHFCATQLLEMGYSHFDVSVQLGHRDGGALVMSRYGHPSVKAAEDRLLAPLAFPEIVSQDVAEASESD